MLDLIPPEGATEEQLELLAEGASEVDIAEYIASLEPLPADAFTPDGAEQ